MKTNLVVIFLFSFSCCLNTFSQEAAKKHKAPKIWDDEKLHDWALPVATLNVRPTLFSEKAYYSSPENNLQTYPVYHPDHEPDGYWEWLHQQEPKPILEKGIARTDEEWVREGKRIFGELDLEIFRTSDKELIEALRKPETFQSNNFVMRKPGELLYLKWVIERKGEVKLSLVECAGCHIGRLPDGTHTDGLAFNDPVPDITIQVLVNGTSKLAPSPKEQIINDSIVPWIQNDKHEEIKKMSIEEAVGLLPTSTETGIFAREDGSPFWMTKVLGLQNIKDRTYLDTTATHRNRGPEDLARYGAHIIGARNIAFGKYKMTDDLTPRIHFSDDILYAIGKYLYSLESPKNPNPPAPELVQRGKEIFEEQNCTYCHTPPLYTNNRLMPVDGFEVPDDHPHKDDIMTEWGPIGVDPGSALKTRKGTGVYKVPQLKGVWYRALFGHDGSVSSLEDWFDPNRLNDDYVPTGWIGPGVEKRAVPGHEYGLDLPEEDKKALIAFLRTL